MRILRRATRALVALVTLVVALPVGYGVRAATDRDPPHGSPASTTR